MEEDPCEEDGIFKPADLARFQDGDDSYRQHLVSQELRRLRIQPDKAVLFFIHRQQDAITICTALHAFNHYSSEPPAKRFIDCHLRMVPKYWEPPELLPGYVSIRDEGRFKDWWPE